MKILVVYASCGAGHRKAAEALFSCLKSRFPGGDIQLLDILDKANIFCRFCYRQGYTFLVTKASLLWRISFWVTSSRLLRALVRPLGIFLDHFNAKEFSEFITRNNFDIVVCTHFLPAELVASAKREKQVQSTVLTIVTDFGVHPFWVSEPTDLYVGASEYTRQQLVQQGVQADKIHILGIPIDQKFLLADSREKSALRLGIRPDVFTVMLMTGSFGMGPLARITKMLSGQVQVLAVCSANKRLYKYLLRKNLPQVKAFEFVEDIQDLMAVADVIITKPGGLTISEALAMQVVPVFISPIPGQEESNLKVLLSGGIAFYPRNLAELKKIILDLKSSPGKLAILRKKIRDFSHPRATEQICDVICQGSIRAAR